VTDPRAKALADKYIGRAGGAPDQDAPATVAEAAWREHAETIHRVLRRKNLKHDAEAAEAIAALESIGTAIAIDERHARGKR
jgi:hypothetical protein